MEIEILRNKLKELRDKHGVILPVIKCDEGMPSIQFTLKGQPGRYNYFMPKNKKEFIAFCTDGDLEKGQAFINDLIKEGIVNGDGSMNYQWPEYHMMEV